MDYPNIIALNRMIPCLVIPSFSFITSENSNLKLTRLAPEANKRDYE
jgi:hypothetical protein